MHIYNVTQAAVSAAATALTLTGSPTSVTTLPVQPTTSELAPIRPWPTIQPWGRIGRSNVASVTTEPEKKTGILFNWGVLRNLTLGNSTVSTWPILIAQILDDTPSQEFEKRDIPHPDTQHPGPPYPPPPAKPAPGDSTLLGRSTRPFNSTRQPFYGWIPVPNPNASVFEPTDRLSNTTHPHNATGANPPTWRWVPLPVHIRPDPPLNWTEQVKKTKDWLGRHKSTSGSFFLPLNKTGGVEDTISDDEFPSKLKEYFESIFRFKRPTHGNSTSTIGPRHEEDTPDDASQVEEFMKYLRKILDTVSLPAHGNSTSTIGPRHAEDIPVEDIEDLKDLISQIDELIEALNEVLGPDGTLPTNGDSTNDIGPRHEVYIPVGDDTFIDKWREALDKVLGRNGTLPTHGNSTNGISQRHQVDIPVGDDTVIDKWREALDKVLGRNGTLPTHGNSTSTVGPRQPAHGRPDTPREKFDKAMKNIIAEASRKHVQEAFDRYFEKGNKFHGKPGKRATDSEPTGALSARQRVYAHVDNPLSGLAKFIEEIIEKASRKHHEAEHATDGKPTGHVRRTARGSLGSA